MSLAGGSPGQWKFKSSNYYRYNTWRFAHVMLDLLSGGLKCGRSSGSSGGLWIDRLLAFHSLSDGTVLPWILET
ncbi:uncharacterized protein K452DRAFT_283879 [Aplosporella prunicola CBS 121167]|uniref:Uncharacterized protein n=1 Tax=Aplosporella prunicola CBS 121167 TaxID=1176127 RepID=A0A6A6BQ02_9PEZI|nr:uncharacterized protein K452DRAFT_283879 [Aplosporella prunicola CBS 121167]KAF2145523.1 hypothetical protein K452DRAFT_283879 [Aplosporella prunicola CBS 121167]